MSLHKVGHTGVYDAAVTAIGATDKAVKTVYDAAEKAGYILLITADHGNVRYAALFAFKSGLNVTDRVE